MYGCLLSLASCCIDVCYYARPSVLLVAAAECVSGWVFLQCGQQAMHQQFKLSFHSATSASSLERQQLQQNKKQALPHSKTFICMPQMALTLFASPLPLTWYAQALIFAVRCCAPRAVPCCRADYSIGVWAVPCCARVLRSHAVLCSASLHCTLPYMICYVSVSNPFLARDCNSFKALGH